MVIGLGAAAAAGLLLSYGTVLQALDLRRSGAGDASKASVLGRLLRRPVWLAGTVIGYLAFPLQLLALAHAPLVLVQPVGTCGLLLMLAAGARMLNERVGLGDIAGVALMILGLGMLAWGSPDGVDPAVSTGALLGAATGLVAISSAPTLPRARFGGVALMICAGLGFAGANMAVKGFSEGIGAHDYLLAGVYLAVAAAGSTIGLLNQMAAFQRRRAVEVVPVTFALPNFLPALLAVLVLREHWASAVYSGAPFAVGGALLLAGITAVARARPVARLAHQAVA